MGGCSGTSSSDGTITYSAQFIGDYVKMHGGPALNLWYDESLLMTAPSTLSLTK
jgi:hypothetical protein